MPSAVVCDVVVELASVGDEDAELCVGDELVEKRFRSDHLGHGPTVADVGSHDDGQRPQHVRADYLQTPGLTLSTVSLRRPSHISYFVLANLKTLVCSTS